MISDTLKMFKPKLTVLHNDKKHTVLQSLFGVFLAKELKHHMIMMKVWILKGSLA